MVRKHLMIVVMLVVVLCQVMPLAGVRAAVTLVRFEATAQPDATKILVVWETATELGTTGFRLYRAEGPSPAGSGTVVFTSGPKGDGVTGAIYEYPDSEVVAGVTYVYRLEELSSKGSAWYGPISAGINVPTATPTQTATATATATATTNPNANPPATVGIILTDTPPPTATQQFTNTPVPEPSGTPPPGAQPPAPTVVRPAATPLPPAAVNTPTGTAPQAPTAVIPGPSATAPAPVQAATSTPQQEVIQPAGLATATPRPARDNTPVIFETAKGTPVPDAAPQSSRNTGLAWVIGGSAIGLAGLLGVILLYLRSRRA